ncbi:MAG: hypothetical protein Q8P49_01750 [Candidatus Liptonbacteria bacterium]|nr:hypothetical protein [Candidatus Liptonbacteria bacterium]
MPYKKILFALGLAGVLYASASFKSSAQQTGPRFFITWSAATYAPLGFTGKTLPTANSPITASFEVINQGKLVDLSGKTIYWYANDTLIENASGKQTATFLAPTIAPNTVTLRIELPNYNGFTFMEVKIPVTTPRAVIEAPYRQGIFSGSSASVRGTPYFFSVKKPSSLAFSWSVNGESAPSAENPEVLTIGLNPDAQSGSPINIGLTIKNPGNFFEQVSNVISLNYVK